MRNGRDTEPVVVASKVRLPHGYGPNVDPDRSGVDARFWCCSTQPVHHNGGSIGAERADAVRRTTPFVELWPNLEQVLLLGAAARGGLARAAITRGLYIPPTKTPHCCDRQSRRSPARCPLTSTAPKGGAGRRAPVDTGRAPCFPSDSAFPDAIAESLRGPTQVPATRRVCCMERRANLRCRRLLTANHTEADGSLPGQLPTASFEALRCDALAAWHNGGVWQQLNELPNSTMRKQCSACLYGAKFSGDPREVEADCRDARHHHSRIPMHRIEQLAIQIFESNRLLRQGGVARWRISLILLDNTAELLMRHQCDYLVPRDDWPQTYLRLVQKQIADGHEFETVPDFLEDGSPHRRLTEIEEELRNQIVTPEESVRIADDFNRKVAYLIKNGILSKSYAVVLKRLHKYRNEAHHEGRVRNATILQAAKIYTYVACSMMKNFPLHAYAVTMPKDLAAMLPTDTLSPAEVPIEVANMLLAESTVGSPEALAATLSEHLQWRLGELIRSIDYLASGMPFTTSSAIQEETLRSVQVNPWTNPPKKFRTLRDINRWQATAATIAKATDHIKAFERFALLETTIEPLEEMIATAVASLDDEIEREIDRRRGV
ncbi:hypothetical protein [Nocardia nova]|uniref:hypothetical protein n=1 Tax=Nocardia nova TaxID=37330 RepID=UPI00189638E9|nr:hypothetical protein [Nocardia nova]MBF6150159.1 hypothetical protein [Nocardia nova]